MLQYRTWYFFVVSLEEIRPALNVANTRITCSRGLVFADWVVSDPTISVWLKSWDQLIFYLLNDQAAAYLISFFVSAPSRFLCCTSLWGLGSLRTFLTCLIRLLKRSFFFLWLHLWLLSFAEQRRVNSWLALDDTAIYSLGSQLSRVIIWLLFSNFLLSFSPAPKQLYVVAPLLVIERVCFALLGKLLALFVKLRLLGDHTFYFFLVTDARCRDSLCPRIAFSYFFIDKSGQNVLTWRFLSRAVIASNSYLIWIRISRDENICYSFRASITWVKVCLSLHIGYWYKCFLKFACIRWAFLLSLWLFAPR